MFKRIYTHVFLVTITGLLAFVLHPAEAQESSRLSVHSGITNEHKSGQIGVGAQVGNMTGLSVDYWTSEVNTLNLSLTGIGGNFGVGAAYDWMFRDVFGTSYTQRSFVPFVGIGALGLFGTTSDSLKRQDQNFALAAQVPIGVEFLPPNQRFAIFAKVSPSVEVTPYGFVFLNGDVGARFYF